MQLDSLCVLHTTKSASKNSNLSPPDSLDAFCFDSCQRRLWVTTRERLSGQHLNVDVFVGQEAYRFLLQVTTGLESAIPGETDVFGQFKEAWRQFQAGGAAQLACEL